nr:antitoxin VbhA family protein [uncultured Albidiferax sp.]
MKTITKQAARNKAVSNVLASLGIEKLTPGEYVVKGMHAYVAGQKTNAALLQEVMHRHVPLRRS